MLHHEFSPSRLEMLDVCSGSYTMQKMAKDPEQTREYTEDGKIKHKLVEKWDALGDLKSEVSNNQLESAEKCVNIIEQIAPFNKWQKEIKVQIIGRDFEELNYGYIDAVFESETMIYAYDWKFGRNKVTPSEKNLQVWNYSVGLMQLYDKPVCFSIYQEPLNFLSSATFDESLIDMFYDKYYSIVAECMDKTKMNLCASYRCDWCKALSICPVGKSAMETSDLVKVEKTGELSHDMLTDYYKQYKVIEKIGDNIKNTIKLKLKKGDEITGFYLKNISGNKFINNPQGMFDQINNYVNVDELMNCINVKISDLETIFIKNYIEKSTDKITKKAAKEEFYRLINDYISRSNDKVQLCYKER